MESTVKNEQTAVVKSSRTRPVRKNYNKIPDFITNDVYLNSLMENSNLPPNYNFEIYKTIYKILKIKATKVALQMPEGLLLFACSLIQIFENAILHFTKNYDLEGNKITSKPKQVNFVILGNVAYGACCVDDFAAGALNCELLIHYGHSCLVPIFVTEKCDHVLYVFVDIKIDAVHFIESINYNFKQHPENLKVFNIEASEIKTVALMGTVQFGATIQACAKELRETNIFDQVILPQSRPLSKGEVLGCTSPKLDLNVDCAIFISDGRFHIEATMIQNPKLPIFKYNPYDKSFTREHYDHINMRNSRKNVIQTAINDIQNINPDHEPWILLLSTLGRQGNSKILENLMTCGKEKGVSIIPVLMAEIQPDKLKHFTQTNVFVQIGCPRLSIDWGPDTIPKPLLSPYEAMIALKAIEIPKWMQNPTNNNNAYPMDFYSDNSSGNWTNNHKDNKHVRRKVVIDI